MKTNDEAVALIASFEGLRLKAYPDPATGGEPFTIGYGHTQGVKPDDVITKEQAIAFLIEDLKSSEHDVERTIIEPMTENQFGALVSFDFNAGRGNLQKLLKNGLGGVPSRILAFSHANGHVMPGLVRRRHAELKLFLKP